MPIPLLPSPPRWALVLGAIAFWLLGCAVVLPRPPQPAAPPFVQILPGPSVGRKAPEPGPVLPGPRLDHAAHLGRGLECVDCHMPEKEEDEPFEPRPIALATCMDCHEDVDEAWPEERRIPNAFFTPAGEPRWKRGLRPYDAEVRWSHAPHAGIECAVCHGDMAETERRDRMLFTMEGCIACHEEREAPTTCATCHTTIRQETPPADHHDPRWLLAHGPSLRRAHAQGESYDCFLCHDKQASCDACHLTQRPPSHGAHWLEDHANRLASGGAAEMAHCAFCHQDQRFCDRCHLTETPPSHDRLWMQRHGEVFRSGGREGQQRCAFCHDQPSFCQSCHVDQEPRNHTHLFRTRTHGLVASIDRDRCATCHTTDFCVRCHTSTPPRSHGPGWASPRNLHCMNCHFPVTTTSCVACHFGTPTHDTAPPMPPWHLPTFNCRNCHNAVGGGGAPPLIHPDPGLDCLSCHR